MRSRKKGVRKKESGKGKWVKFGKFSTGNSVKSLIAEQC